ncbi:MAG: hypothetical protein ACLGSA_12665 [Acidobacteriota bacterium]
MVVKSVFGEPVPPKYLGVMKPSLNVWMNLNEDGSVSSEKTGIRIRVQVYDSSV